MALVVLAVWVAVFQGVERAPLPYEPLLPRWFGVVICSAALWPLLWCYRYGADVPALFSLAGGIALFTCWLSGVVIGQSSYLMYHWGNPKPQPTLGWGVLTVYCLCVAVPAVFLRVREKARPTRRFLSTALVLAALSLAACHFVGVNWFIQKGETARSVVSIDQETGAVRWFSGGLIGQPAQTDRANSGATPTPVVHQGKVYAFFAGVGLACVDGRGQLVWVNRSLPFENVYGVGLSPVAYKDRVFVLTRSSANSQLCAVSCDTGEIIWSVERICTSLPSGDQRTPIIRDIDGTCTIILATSSELAGYSVQDGERLWLHAFPSVSGDSVASMVSEDDRLFLSGAHATQAFDLRRLATDVNSVLWRQEVEGCNCVSPVVSEGFLFILSDHGLLHCLKASSGETVWTRKFKGEYRSSLLAMAKCVYLSSLSGETTVVTYDGTFRVIGNNHLDIPITASLVPVGNQLLIRTSNALYCIGSYRDVSRQ